MKRVAQTQHLSMQSSVRRLARLVVFSLSACSVHTSTAHAQTRTRDGASNASRPAIERRVRTFYAFWVGQAKRDKDPLENRAMIGAYASKRLTRWLYSPAYRTSDEDVYGADYFMQAQDFDHNWDQVRISDVRVQGGVARLFATLGSPKAEGQGIGPWRLRLKMVKENGQWKIDSVDAVDL